MLPPFSFVQDLSRLDADDGLAMPPAWGYNLPES
jgi:hypothetical protein